MMKVFINFGTVRCVVPVGDGSLSVREVIDLAVERYRKATSNSKASESKVVVHTLKTSRDGAILDLDDTLHDVADDREQLIAIFDDDGDQFYQHQAKTNGFYEEVSNAGLGKVDSSQNGCGPPSQLPRRYGRSADELYGRTRVLFNGASTNPFSETYSHQRSGSISDSVLSSNESPLVFHDDVFEEAVPNHSSNGFKPPGSQNHPISIAHQRRAAEFMLSRSYDPKLGRGMGQEDSNDVVEITADQINSYSAMASLHVRHGSEPSLFHAPEPIMTRGGERRQKASPGSSQLLVNGHITSDLIHHNTKRWSTAIAVERINQPTNPSTLIANNEHSDEDKTYNSISPQSAKEEGYASEERSNSQSEMAQSTSPTGVNSPQSFSKFTRGSGRHSMLNNNLDDWADAADRQLMRLRIKEDNAKSQSGHKEDSSRLQKHPTLQVYDSSLGSMSSSSQENDQYTRYYEGKHDLSSMCITVIINLAKESGPLGIHVLPDTSNGTNTLLHQGLLVHGIEPGGRIDRDGRLQVGDTIVEVDDNLFAGLNFEKAQELFRSSLLRNDQIKMRIIKSSQATHCDNSSQQLASLPPAPPAESDLSQFGDIKDKEVLVEGEERAGQQTRLASVTPTRKHSPGLLNYKPTAPAIVVANTRRIGKKYHIQLKKEQHGLGFTITTRDNPTGGLSPIYIKTILPRGAAVQDGRLKPGDRLLEVCGVEMTGKSQEEAVKILRNLPMDSIVDLIVSRQEVEVSPSPLMPRQLPSDSTESRCSSPNEREVMTFQVPLNDTGSAGLGISVKGKTLGLGEKQQDLGIFIKSVFHGGAAFKDGRLRQDDQLININGIPLSGKTNSEAMETLRRAMIQSAESITLTIARRICGSPSHLVDSSDGVAGDTMTISYRHHHEASILSNDSYDMSFNAHPTSQINDSTSPRSHNGSGCHEEDSYRSSENTVIYNASACPNHSHSNEASPEVANGRDKSLHDSQISLNDDQFSERFKRDGFGRQSMSEKRHAQLDAKSTDTYRRSKKNRDHPLQERSTSDQMTATVGTAPYGEDEQLDEFDQMTTTKDYSPPVQKNGFKETSLKVRSPSKNPPIFSPSLCWKCQSPGSSCPCRSKSTLSTEGCSVRINGHPAKNTQLGHLNSTNAKDVAPFGLRRSCSLESLQMMMQDLQKEQVEKVGGNIPGFSGPPHGQLRSSVGQRARETNESFRVAVDRSYEVKNYINRPNMHSAVVDEEGGDSNDDSMSRPSTCPYRVGGGHSMTSTNLTATTTNLTTTTNDDDNAHLLKSKKKKGLFKNLFHFGSRKGRSKSIGPNENFSSKSSDADKEETRKASFYSPDLTRKYQIEQEKINMHYRKLLEQQKQKQQFQFVRNQLHPMHQSMPMAAAKFNASKMEHSMVGTNRGATVHPSPPQLNPQIYGTFVGRDTVGVPHVTKVDKMNTYLRPQRRVHPEMNVSESNSFGESNPQMRLNDNSRHMHINSQEFYGRASMERPGSRVAISENNNYGTYGLYANYSGGNLAGGRSFATVSRTEMSAGPNELPVHHYRQLSLRNPQHHRQVSSPATSQQYYQGNQTRPLSSYFEYEHAGYLNSENQRRNMAHQAFYQVTNHQPSQVAKKETMYGIVGQQHSKSVPGGVVLRKQQPIYQSNQVQIYGTVYNPNQHGQASFSGANQTNSRSNMHSNYSHNGLPNAFSTKG